MSTNFVFSIVLLTLLGLLACASETEPNHSQNEILIGKVDTSELNIDRIQLKPVFNSKLREDSGNTPRIRKNRKDPQIALKQQNDNSKPFRRAPRVAIPDNWDKNPFIMQTYK